MTSNQEFHAYVQSILAHMPEWQWHAESNLQTLDVSGSDEKITEHKPYVTILHTGSRAAIILHRDDYRKKFDACAERGRHMGNKRLWLADSFKAEAGFSQGREPKQVARAILAKVAPGAIAASAELDRLVAEAKSERAAMLTAIESLNAAKVLNRPIPAPKPHDGACYWYGPGVSGTITEYGKVRIDRTLEVDAETAAKILRILADAKHGD